MKQSHFKKGIIYATMGSLWWGVLGTIFFKYITYMGAFEVTLHRLIWTCFILFVTTITGLPLATLSNFVELGLTSVGLTQKQIFGEKGDVGSIVMEHPRLGMDSRIRLGMRSGLNIEPGHALDFIEKTAESAFMLGFD